MTDADTLLKEIPRKEDYTPHKIVYAVPFLRDETHADLTERLSSSMWREFQIGMGGMDVKVSTTIYPKIRLTDENVFRKTDAGILLPRKFPAQYHPSIFDMDLPGILPLLYRTSEEDYEKDEDLPEIRFRTLKIFVQNILILDVTPV